MKDPKKKTNRNSLNRSPQLMDWIMLDNNIKPITEHKKVTTHPPQLAPIEPNTNKVLRNFKTPPTKSPQMKLKSRYARNTRDEPGQLSLVNPSQGGSIDL